MKATLQDNPPLNHDQIARLACRLWESEGCQSGRDQHYWLAAERQLQALRQPNRGRTKPAAARRPVPPTAGRMPPRQRLTAAPSTATQPRKRA